MPVPEPRKDEEQADYVSRCMEFMGSERDLSEEEEMQQAQAICHRTYREAKSMNFAKLTNMLSNESKQMMESLSKLPIAQMEEEDSLMMFMLHDEISEDGITSNDLVARIKGMKPDMQLVFDINSVGGSVYDACSIHNAMVDYPGKVRADITGVCGSAMTMVASGADEIRIGELGSYFVHEASAVWAGTKHSMRGMADMLTEADQMIAEALAKRSGMEKDEVLSMMEKDGFGSMVKGKDAVEMGFADSLIPSKSRDEDRKLTVREEREMVNLQMFQIRNMRRKLAAKMSV